MGCSKVKNKAAEENDDTLRKSNSKNRREELGPKCVPISYDESAKLGVFSYESARSAMKKLQKQEQASLSSHNEIVVAFPAGGATVIDYKVACSAPGPLPTSWRASLNQGTGAGHDQEPLCKA